ncbi:AvrD family protein [Streptomyces sp. NPDC001401]|uniref:AvrD family protein n=1 Tax=Streptomyces sp. NPDC001401 TaxID=3364570 RepID=UPI00368BD537
MASATASMASIDDSLGPVTRRFFGDGHRRVDYRFGEVTVAPGPPGSGSIGALVSVICPPDWSKKGDTDQRPHLSTIDALIIGGRLAELFLTRRHGLTERERAAVWLRRVEIRAGNAPDEENLESLSAEATLRTTRLHETDESLAVSVLDCTVGGMRIRSDLVHPVGRLNSDTTSASYDPDLAALLPGVYGEGFKHRRQPITDVSVDIAQRRADAQVAVVTVPGAHYSAGMEGAYQPSVSFIDAFVVTLQMGQALLYGLDKVPRARSNTLWMRRTVLESDTPHRPAAGPFPVTTELTDATLLDVRGVRWRTADITSDCAGVRVMCSVTHEIPQLAATVAG